MSGSRDNFPNREGYALVTGAAARLGAAIATRLAEEGWAVALHYRSSGERAEALVKKLTADGHLVLAVKADLFKAEELERVFAGASALGFCSLLVNNASQFEYDDIDSVSPASMDSHYEANLRAPILLAHQFAKQLPADKKGLIVNLLDQKVFNLNPDFFSYTVMKKALEGATTLLAMALAPRIRVCGVAPGLSLRSGNQTDKGFAGAHAQTPLGFGNEPDDVVEAVCFAIRCPAVTGSTIVVDAGQSLVKRSDDVMFSYGLSENPPAQ